ncbi:hypothetical protein WK90_32690 [Burkholderia cepacia]|nr:hypothetical protein WK83_32520 [Burkholderia cepacia]KVV67376.1 hypothetical protein WK85_24205 [Burkholderia cepacia]KVV70646.1 hypothetical protein WK84_13420 [Burkholderia cepacia]KVV77053.1 hypothetical protein WK87_34460 [Burkholderia cepacia]KVV85168.1 hypothetical protein WK86_11470 [Burkholderia cepacia]
MLAGAPQAAEQLRDFVVFLVMQRDKLVAQALDGEFRSTEEVRTIRNEFERKIEEFLGMLATEYNKVGK